MTAKNEMAASQLRQVNGWHGSEKRCYGCPCQLKRQIKRWDGWNRRITGYYLMLDFDHFGVEKASGGEFKRYYSLEALIRAAKEIKDAPDGASGTYCKSGQRKRRKNRRRNRKWRHQ